MRRRGARVAVEAGNIEPGDAARHEELVLDAIEAHLKANPGKLNYGSAGNASAGHLDKRGTGDLWTLTVQEYLEASRGRRFAYRLARNSFEGSFATPAAKRDYIDRLDAAFASA